MSATIEINALSSGSGSGKYEVNSNIVVSGLSAAGDCSAGTPGKYRPLRLGPQPRRSAGGDPSACDQETFDTVDSNVDEDSTPDHKTDNFVDSKETISAEDNDIERQNPELQETDENALRNVNSAECSHPNNEDLQLDNSSCQYTNIDVNFNMPSNRAHISSEFDSGAEKLEPEDSSPEAIEISVASETNKQEDNSVNNNSSSPSPRDEDQEETVIVKQKSKKKGGILQAVQFHLPKFSMKRGQIANKDRESSTSSGPEGSPEKKSGKKKKKDKHVKKRLDEEDEKQDEDGDVALVNDGEDENAQIEEGSQTVDSERNKSVLSREEKGEFVQDSDKKPGSDQEEDGGITMVTQTPTASIPMEEEAQCSGIQMEESWNGMDAGQVATSGPVENEQNPDEDAVAAVTEEDADDKIKDECRDKVEITNAVTPGPTDNEPSSILNSSLASAEDFYNLPQSSISSSTNPGSSEISEDQCEDTSTTTTKQGDSSTLGEEDSIAETSTRSRREAGEISSETDNNSSAAVKTDEPVQKPDLIPGVEKSRNVDFFLERPDVKNLEQNREPSVLSSSNQSSFDTDSPSLADTPEHSPKKKSKRRVPILNVTLPTFGKKHHRSTKSPEQSSDSDRSSSPSKKFSWKKKSPKKVSAPVAVGSTCISTEEESKDADSLPDKGKTQKQGSFEMSHTTTEEAKTELKVGVSARIVVDATVAVDLPESMEDEKGMSASDDKGEVEEVSCEVLVEAGNEGQEDDTFLESKGQDKFGSDGKEEAGEVSCHIEDAEQEDDLHESEEGQDEKMEVAVVSCEGLPEADDELQEEEQLEEELPVEVEGEVTNEISADVLTMPPGMLQLSRNESDRITSGGEEEQEGEEEEMKGRDGNKPSLPEDDSIDVQDNETSEMVPGVKFEGRIHMSASLEVHASPTHHVSSPADFILTDDSMEVEDDIGGDVGTPQAPQGDVSVELTAGEKILKECNQLVADDSVGDIQFTPEMLSEFTKTIDAFEKEEEKEDGGGGEERRGKEELQIDIGDDDKDMDLEGPDSFEIHVEETGTGDHLSSEVIGSVPVDVGCQMTWEDGESENEGDDEVKTGGMDGKIEIAFGHERDMPNDTDKRSVSSSSSSSSSSESEAQEVSPEDAEASAELHITAIARKDDKILPEIGVLPADPTAGNIQVEVSTKPDKIKGIDVSLTDSQPVEIVAEIKLPESSDLPSEVAVDVSSPSIPQIQPSVKEASFDVNPAGVAGKKVQVVMSEEGSLEPKDEGPSSPTQEIKPKSKSKGFFSGFNLRMPRFRGRHSGKLDVTSKNDRPDISESKISFKTDEKMGSDAEMMAVFSGLSNASSELDVSRRRSTGSEDEFSLANQTPSVPDISQREMALKRAKKKSFTLPNMHLRLPGFSGKKSPKSATANKISLPSADEVNVAPPTCTTEGSLVLDGKVEIDADIPAVSSSEAEVTIEADMKTDLPSSDIEKAIPEVQLPTLNTVKVETPSVQANGSNSLGKEDGIGAEVLVGKAQVDGLYVAVPVFVEEDSGSEECIQFPNGEKALPEMTADLETELDTDVTAKLQAWRMDVGVPSLSDVQSDSGVEQKADSADADLKIPADVEVDGGIVDRLTLDNCEAEFSVKPEVSLPSDHQTEAEMGFSCSVGAGVHDDGKMKDVSYSPTDVGLGGSFDAELTVADEVKSNLPDRVTVEAVDGEEGSSDITFVDKLELMAPGESDSGRAVDVDVSVGLALSAGSGDAFLENQVKTTEPSKEADEKLASETDARAMPPNPKYSPTKYRFKLPSLNFSLPKFGGSHSPTKKSSTKKSKMVITPSAEVCGAGCEILEGGDKVEEVGVSMSNTVEEETIPEPVIESELQTSFVEPEVHVDIKGDLEMRFGSLDEKDNDLSHDIKDDISAKLDFDTDEIPQEFSFNMDSNSEPNLNGLEHDDIPSSFNDFGVHLDDISCGAQVSPSYLKCGSDKDGCECHGSVQSQEDPGSSVDLNWEDEMCSRVQVTTPIFRLSDIRGGLSLGVAVSEDGLIRSDAEEMQNDEPDGPNGGTETADSTERSLPDMLDLTMNSAEHPNVEMISSPQLPAPELILSVDVASSQRKQSISSHSSAKSTSSRNSQTNASKNPKKKGGIMASLTLPKLHRKLPSPRSKTPDRRAAEPDEHVEGTSPTNPEAAKSPKKPGGKRSKKGRWMPGKSSSKGKYKKESGGKADGSNGDGIPKVGGNADASPNIKGGVEVDINGQSSWKLDPQPSTSYGPSTSTPIKPTLSLNNSAQTPPTPCSTNSLNIEQAIAVHSSPATPVSPQPPFRKPFGVVVAIDFGTTFSGYAYSFTRDPDDVQIMRKWEGGDPGVTNMKTPTTLLLHPSGAFHSFGFTARDFYHDMDHNDALQWMYFDKFKLALHNDPDLNLETELAAANGQKLEAIKVFEHSLRFFREHAVEELCDQSNDGRFDLGDIRWVLTVPAIWKQPAKQFMREAAYRAGIASTFFPEQLLIALEPEAASICIRKLRMRELVPERLSQRRKWSADKPERSNSQVAENITHGTRYMVVDCGGGTVDITVHEVEEDAGTLKELHKATGGMYGSVSVDTEFEKLLVNIFGKEYIEEFKIKRPAGWVDLMIAFESRKRNVSPYKSNPLNVSLPFSFIDYYKKYTQETATVEDAIWNYRSRDVTWSAQGMLRFSPEGMQQLFRPAVANIISLVEGLLNEPQLEGVSYLFLAGGFAQSPLLQNQIRKKFTSRLRVIIPRDVGLAILKGAVMFGLDPTAVRVRRSRLTYGVGVLNKFVPARHPKEKHIVKDKTEWCRDIFDMFVQADQSVAVGDKVTRSYTPAKPSQKALIINIYCTEKDKVQFITDEGVQKCGTMHIDVSDSQSADLTKRRELQLTMQYGDTEIKVSALDVPTGRCVKSNIDFLSK